MTPLTLNPSIAGMVVRQPDFTCCTRRTTEAGKPAWTTDDSSLTVPEDPWLNAASSIKKILADYLIQISKVDDIVKEQVINYTFDDDASLFKTFIHDVEREVFSTHAGLPDYEWDEKAKTSILQADSKYKGSSCSRNEHVVYLYEHLVGFEQLTE